MTKTGAAVEEVVVEETDYSAGWKTLLFNCDCHTFDQVEEQLIKAIRCSIARAREFSNEVHTKGLAIVYRGPRERCEAVAAVLEAVGLLVKVAQ